MIDSETLSEEVLDYKNPVLDARNANLATQYVDSEAKKKGSRITEVFIRNTRGILMKDRVPDSEVRDYRHVTVFISNASVTPPAYENVPRLMKEYVEELDLRMNNCGHGVDCLSEVVSTLAFSHYAFVRIHPFDDGNGRSARLIGDFITKKFNLRPVIIHPKEHDEYIATLERVNRTRNIAHLEAFLAKKLKERYKEEKNGHGKEVHDFLTEIVAERTAFARANKSYEDFSRVWDVLDSRSFD